MSKSWINSEYEAGVVSVIIPVYNRAKLLEDAIQSVTSQTYRCIECIVVDDGSTDDTKAVFNKINEKTFENCTLRYTYQPNAGAQVARNTGTILSRGEFIQYLDSDDLLYARKIEEQVKYLGSHPDCNGVYGDWQKGTLNENIEVKAFESQTMLVDMVLGKCIANFSFLMRRSLVEKIGPWDKELRKNQEIDYHLRGILSGGKFDYQPLNCGLWRTHYGARIANTSGAPDLLSFFRKWENILREKELLTGEISAKIASLLFWFYSQDSEFNEEGKIMLLKEIVRLDPRTFGFESSRKYKTLKRLMGAEAAFKIWSVEIRKPNS